MDLIELSPDTNLKVRQIRTEKGYSQEYMAECLGISQNTYSRIESGQIRLTTNRLIQIAILLQVSFLVSPKVQSASLDKD